MRRPILFIDRDGTIITEPDDFQIDSIDKVDFLPDALHYLRKIKEEMNFLFVMVTNQDGLDTPSFPSNHFWPVHELVMRVMKSESIEFDAVHIDTHFQEDNHPNRKPGIGMLKSYLTGEHNIESSYVIGDRTTDVQLARNLGCKAIHIFPATISDAELTTESWKDIYEYLKEAQRKK